MSPPAAALPPSSAVVVPLAVLGLAGLTVAALFVRTLVRRVRAARTRLRALEERVERLEAAVEPDADRQLGREDDGDDGDDDPGTG